MWKEENLNHEYITIDAILESLEFKGADGELVGALLNYTDIEKCFDDEIDFSHIPNTKKVWMEIASGLAGLIQIDYTPKGNLQPYADELLDTAKFRIEHNVFPKEDFTIPEIIDEIKEKIKVLTKLLYQIKAIDPKTIEETADAFINKSESEYQKIINDTAEKFVEKSDLFSVDDVAKLCDESPETIKNFCLFQKYVDKDGLPTLYGYEVTKYIYKSLIHNEFFFTIAGKDHVVAVYDSIKRAEKGLKPNSIGLAE